MDGCVEDFNTHDRASLADIQHHVVRDTLIHQLLAALIKPQV